jgi:hypothetical protein
MQHWIYFWCNSKECKKTKNAIRLFTIQMHCVLFSKFYFMIIFRSSKKEMYKGEPIIIHNSVAFVFLLAALSFSCASLGVVSFLSQLSRYEVARLVPLSQPNVNHRRSTFHSHQETAAFSDPFFVVWRCIRGWNQRLSAQYGNSVLPQRSVYEWIEKLKNGRISFTHEEGAERPSTATTDDNIERVRDMVMLHRRPTTVLMKWQIVCKLWKMMLL